MKLGNLFGKRMKDPVHGTGQVVSVTMPPRSGTSSNCRITMVVRADGVVPTSVRHHDWHVKKDRWPTAGDVLPIEIDRADPTRMEILWDEVPRNADEAIAAADALAASMQGEAQAGPSPTSGVPPEAQATVDQLQQMFPGATVEVNTVDVSEDPNAVAAAERALGQDLDGDGAIGGHRPGTSSAAGEPTDGAGDRITQLERLARLQEQGALTDEEFEAEKARLLGR